MTDINYRAATEDDIPAALDLFSETLLDLYHRHNLPATPLALEQWRPGYLHVLRTGIFRVAEDGEGRLAAVCLAMVRDHLWFLSGFWVRPDLQKQGIGGPLLRQIRQAGADQGARVFSVWSTIDTGAVACYLRQGMLPGFQILIFSGTPIRLPEKPDGYRTEPLLQSTAVGIDRTVRGTGRDIDHHFWLEVNEPRGLARQVMHDGDVVGYYYIHFTTIGPAAWTDGSHAQAVLALAAHDAAGRNSEIRMVVPGINHTAIRFALDCGLRLTIAPHFLTSAPFGKLDQYLISGPTLL